MKFCSKPSNHCQLCHRNLLLWSDLQLRGISVKYKKRLDLLMAWEKSKTIFTGKLAPIATAGTIHLRFFFTSGSPSYCGESRLRTRWISWSSILWFGSSPSLLLFPRSGDLSSWSAIARYLWFEIFFYVDDWRRSVVYYYILLLCREKISPRNGFPSRTWPDCIVEIRLRKRST